MNDLIAEPFIWPEEDAPDHGVSEQHGRMTIYRNLVQGSDEWFAARLGLLTASEMSRIITPTFKVANNDKTRQHVYEIAAQRISGYVEPTYIGDAMLRGHEDEVRARLRYAEEIAPVTECGFMVNEQWGFGIGYSPDGLVGDDGLIECKSRAQKYQVQTIADHVATGSATIPMEFMAQIQTGLMVSGRQWCDFISYCGGLPMVVIRVHPDEEIQAAILDAAEEFERQVQSVMDAYEAALTLRTTRAFPTERVIEQEIY